MKLLAIFGCLVGRVVIASTTSKLLEREERDIRIYISMIVMCCATDVVGCDRRRSELSNAPLDRK